MVRLPQLLREIRHCAICREHLPLGPRPVFQFSPAARILIAGQAPGRKVHASGVPFDDASGSRLRDWLGISPEVFYDAQRVAILPMGFCYPGTGSNGDLPPRSECASAWRETLLARLEKLEVTLAIGEYSHSYHLPNERGTVTSRVQAWRKFWPTVVPLPHPSPRNNLWLRRNPWFESDLLPALKQRISDVLYSPATQSDGLK